MPGSIKIDDGSGNYTILTNAGSLGLDKTITIPNETGTLNLQSGSVLQVVSASDTTAASYSIGANSNQKLGSLEVSITPKATSSKILLLATVNTGLSGRYNSLNFYRDSTVLGMSDQATGSRTNAGVYLNSGAFTEMTFQCLSTSMEYLDSPSSTSAITYSVHITRRHSTDTVYYNRPENDTDAAYIMRTRSHITAMEIGG
jgi:hypothetical protein